MTEMPTPGGAPPQSFEEGMLLSLLANSKFLEALSKMQYETLVVLKDMQRRLVPSSDKQLYLTLPDAGGMYSIGAGATTIDFENGVVLHSSGAEANMRSSLRTQGLVEMRSFILVTQDAVDVSLDGGGKYTLGAGERLCIGDFAFKTLYIEASEGTYIKLMASTTPEMTSFYDRYFSQDLEDVLGKLTEDSYDADLTVAQTITLDTGSSMSRITVEAYGEADKDTDWYLEASNDGSHWFEIDTAEAQTAYHWGGHNATQYIRLTSAAAGVAGDKVSLVLTATR